MANEWTLVFETELPIPFTVSDSVAVEKGTLMQLSDPFTASAATAAGQMIAGISAEEKIANDGKTKLGVYRAGIFKGTASGAILIGQACAANTNNTVIVAGITVSGSAVVGHSFETAALNETFLMDMHIGGMGNQIA